MAQALVIDTLIPQNIIPQAQLPETLKKKAADLLEKLRKFLPSDNLIEEIAIFKARERVDPVIAVKILGQWYSLFEWE